MRHWTAHTTYGTSRIYGYKTIEETLNLRNVGGISQTAAQISALAERSVTDWLSAWLMEWMSGAPRSFLT